jgi:hypothetical protein
MIKKIAFYDFDGTLIDSPVPETGKARWKEVTGEEYPHIGWWGRKESLDTEVFDIKPIPSIYNQLMRDTAKSDTYTVLLTSRLKKLLPEIENVLKTNGIELDSLSPKRGGEEKDVRVKEFLEKFPDVDTIDLYDDRDKEMKVFSNLKKEIGDKYQVNIYKVDGESFALHETALNINEIISEEVSIYIKKNNV